MSERVPERELAEDHHRHYARTIRDHHWQVLERIAEHDPLWICWWDKRGHHRDRRGREPAPDVEVFGLIDGMEFLNWLNDHPDWTVIGEWSAERYAAPVTLTAAGRAALDDRAPYDLEPVRGGLVEPGWKAIPFPKDNKYCGQ